MKRVCIDLNSWITPTKRAIFENESVLYNKDINRLIIDNVKEIIFEHGFITIYYVIKPYRTRQKELFDIMDIKNLTIN